MNLNQYENLITEICESNLSAEARGAALHLVATTIDGCAWNPPVRERARELAERCRAAIPSGVDLLTRLDELAVSGRLAEVPL